MDLAIARQVERRYVRTRFGQVHLATVGQGPPLLMLHSTPRSWRQFLPLLPDLVAGGRQLILPDTLGFGASDPLPPDVTAEDLADAALDVLDALGLPRTDLYGFHTGNKIAAALAQRAPDRIGRLVLSGQTHSLIPDKVRRDDAIWRIVRKYYAGADRAADTADPLRRWAADFAVLSATWWDVQALSAPSPDEERLGELERYAADFIACRHSLIPIYRANFAFDFGACLAALSIPPHVVEFATPSEEHFGRQAGILCALCPGATATTLENTGSDAHETRAAALAALLLDTCRPVA